ncbi:hypothetical protein NE237_017067 [Protea cynaroides]|uniref:Uncharacterized protein n=1 Tax=Protea cynaroides TaxID=273540 RepID=A0A9Q0QMF6_9MAGN|nr:hypothetical protein NE237_017067 [Protea cynaroides]
MNSKGYSLDQWRKFFQIADTNIFDVIEQSIMVAAIDHPEELKVRRDRFAEFLFNFTLCRCSAGSKKEKSVDSSKIVTVAVIPNSSTCSLCSVSCGDGVTAMDEEEKLKAKMENSKRRVIGGYQRAEHAKKLRRIQILDLNNLPKQDLRSPKRRIVSRRR